MPHSVVPTSMTAREAAARAWPARIGPALRRVVRVYLLAAGVAATLLALWLVSPVPLYVSRPLLFTEAPAPAAAIVCLGSGVDDGLPSTTGWHRIRMSVRLHHEGFAPVVIFSGGPVPGSGGRPVAELYAEAAQLLGLPASASIVEPRAENTADHPRRLLDVDFVRNAGGQKAPLLVVTTTYHGLRTALCFRRAGFVKTRVVTRLEEPYPATDPPGSPSSFARKARARLYALLATLEEWTALAVYKVRGWI